MKHKIEYGKKVNYAFEEDIYEEQKKTRIIERTLYLFLFLDAFSTYILLSSGYQEKNTILILLFNLSKNWLNAILLWLVFILLIFYILRNLLGYEMRREYRSVILTYIAINLILSVINNWSLLL